VTRRRYTTGLAATLVGAAGLAGATGRGTPPIGS